MTAFESPPGSHWLPWTAATASQKLPPICHSGVAITTLSQHTITTSAAIALVLVLALTTLAAADVQAAAVQRGPSFQTPSGNIHCLVVRVEGHPRHLRCDIHSGLNPEPSRDCELDWGGLTLRPRRRGRPMCAGDTAFDRSAPVLDYGTTWKRGPFTCRSRRTGLTCRNDHRHGIFLSRSEWRVW